jgi:hypothetical protein
MWQELHLRARLEKTTISDLVRNAVRARYMDVRERRKEAMLAAIGIRDTPRNAPTAVEEVRALRKGNRLDRLMER